ncbi:MAG TPA: hypothetical protein VMV90_07945 [Rectinemataceae bacterium]|nr:hypothetical protein [Rectinemataceae bacterium]
MNIREFFLDVGTYILPRTPAGALKAFESGFCPIEAFIYKSTSTKPVDEEPYDIEEIDRILARPNLDFRTNLVLMGVFEKLIHHQNQELALWAAESINVLENRYNARIASIKKGLGRDADAGAGLSELARVNFELALLNGKRQAIKEFYIDQSLANFKELLKLRRLEGAERNTYIRALMEARDYEAAAELLEVGPSEATPEDILLIAEIEYSQKHFDRASNVLSRLAGRLDKLGEREAALYAYWMGA